MGFILKELGISYQEMMWGVPWQTILRMLADLPRQVEKDKAKQNKELTPQTSDDFKAYINQLNQKKKQE